MTQKDKISAIFYGKIRISIFQMFFLFTFVDLCYNMYMSDKEVLVAMGKPELVQKLYQDDPRPCFSFSAEQLLIWGNPAFLASFPLAQEGDPISTVLTHFSFEDLLETLARTRSLQLLGDDKSCLSLSLFYNRKTPFYMGIFTQNPPITQTISNQDGVLLLDYYINSLTHPLLLQISNFKRTLESSPDISMMEHLLKQIEIKCRLLTKFSYLTETYYRTKQKKLSPTTPISFRGYFSVLMQQTQLLFDQNKVPFSYSCELAGCGLMLDVKRFEIALLNLFSICYEYEKRLQGKLFCRAIYDQETLHLFIEDNATNTEEINRLPEEEDLIEELSQTDDLVLLYRMGIATLQQVIEQHGGSCEIADAAPGIQIHITLPAWIDTSNEVNGKDEPSLLPIMLANLTN